MDGVGISRGGDGANALEVDVAEAPLLDTGVLVVERTLVRHSSNGTPSTALGAGGEALATIFDPAGNAQGLYQEPRR